MGTGRKKPAVDPPPDGEPGYESYDILPDGQPIPEFDWRGVFLNDLAKHGVISRAAATAGVWPGMIYREKKRDPAFAELAEERQEIATDKLLDAAWREALGSDDRRPNVLLLMFLIKARRPEYRDNYKTPDDKARERATTDALVLNASALAMLAEQDARVRAGLPATPDPLPPNVIPFPEPEID